MITFQNKNSFPVDDLKGIDKTISTLLIPAQLVKPLKEKIKEHGNLFPVYLRNLLWMFRTFTHSGMIPHPQKLKTEYQKEGLDLQRVNLRPFNEDWMELGELALVYGKSRCWLFTFLLELDLLGFWETLSEFSMGDAVPTTTKLRLRVSLSLKRVSQDFSRNYHVRV